MQKILMFCGILLYLPFIAAAQDHPKEEIFAGYSYLNGQLDGNFSGFDISAAGNFNEWFGVAADFSYHYVSGRRVHSFLLGPKFTFREKERVNPYFQTLFCAVLLGNGGKDTVFGWAAGGGVDVKVHKNVAIRVIDMTYMLVRDHGFNSSNGRLSSGLVWRCDGK